MMIQKLKFLGKALFCKHPYFEVLPYNLPWLDSFPRSAWLSSSNRGIVVYDVGARSRSIPELSAVSNLIDYIAFDADAAECHRLQTLPTSFRSSRYLPYYIGVDGKRVDFHITKAPGCSSSLRPSARFSRLFAASGQAEIDEVYTLHGSSLKTIITTESLPPPDLIKLDTQGTELEILQHSGAIIGTTPIIEVEVEFIEQYEGQPLFFSVAEFLYGQGYELVHLNRMFKQRSGLYSGPARGQLLFGDALFVLREEHWGRLDREALLRFVILLWVYGHRDIAYHVSSEYLSAMDAKNLAPLFANRLRYGSFASRLTQFAIGKADWIAMAWLAIRRTNQLRSEQDRTWPIR